MKHLSLPRTSLLSAVMSGFLAAPAAFAAFDSGSTGALGALSPTVNTEITLPEDGVLNYTTINIPTGVKVTFKKNTLNTPVYLLASGDVTIAGTLSLNGLDAKSTGTDGDGALGDDGVPGAGGPGGFDGGRGGREDSAQRVDIIRGGSGLGPGGGRGGVEGGDTCGPDGYHPYVGVGGAYGSNAYRVWIAGQCGAGPRDASRFSKAYGSAILQPLVGGSGGGGGRGGATYPGSGGGGGGGGVLLASSTTIRITGMIDTTGGDGGGLAGPGAGGRGAGGSGGAIRLIASTITGAGGLYANGGCINESGSRRRFCGSDGNNQYGGAPGRIRLEADAITFTGPSQPAYSKDLPGSVFIAGAPSLRIASVAGVAVPAQPTGNADVSLPASTTAPVSVVFNTVNVPTGNTVLLRVVPAYGNVTEALSPAISGSAEAGSTSVSVTLPQGPSTLQATTTYTVVVAAADQKALSMLANNQKVEKVEVTVALQGAPKASLITASGKRIEVSYQRLLAAGFRG